jgi:hypothetical protein
VDGFRRHEIDEEFAERPLRRARAEGVVDAATSVAGRKESCGPAAQYLI